MNEQNKWNSIKENKVMGGMKPTMINAKIMMIMLIYNTV